MSGRRGRRVPAGRELADHLIERINDLRLENPYPGKVEILGGYIRSYAFQYEDNASYFQGSIFFESPADDKGIATVEATFIILDEEHEEGEAGRIVGQNVYDSTAGFYGYRDSIANIYLTAYCSKVSRWVIAYERFDSYFDDVIPGCPPFYENESGSRVSQFWIDTIRQIIESLSCIHGEGVVHGRMYSPKSYVVDSNMTLKLINIGRYSRSGVSTSHGDITGFFDYLCSQSSLGVSSSQEWVGFEYLYRSEEAMNNR
uniref:Protein kinase domain-containing protein n=1 Tax=Oryza glumipatula TaxID=40148 RepID=A0A0E0BBI4_9ORYZ